MEQEAQYRDQVLLACAAQEPKMLPKRPSPEKSSNSNTKAKLQSVHAIFDAMEAQESQ